MGVGETVEVGVLDTVTRGVGVMVDVGVAVVGADGDEAGAGDGPGSGGAAAAIVGRPKAWISRLSTTAA